MLIPVIFCDVRWTYIQQTALDLHSISYLWRTLCKPPSFYITFRSKHVYFEHATFLKWLQIRTDIIKTRSSSASLHRCQSQKSLRNPKPHHTSHASSYIFEEKSFSKIEIPRHVRTFLKSTNLSRCLAIFRLAPRQISNYAHSRSKQNRDKPDYQAWYSSFLHPLDLCWLAQCGSSDLPLLPSTRLRANKTALTRVF